LDFELYNKNALFSTCHTSRVYCDIKSESRNYHVHIKAMLAAFYRHNTIIFVTNFLCNAFTNSKIFFQN